MKGIIRKNFLFIFIFCIFLTGCQNSSQENKNIDKTISGIYEYNIKNGFKKEYGYLLINDNKYETKLIQFQYISAEELGRSNSGDFFYDNSTKKFNIKYNYSCDIDDNDLICVSDSLGGFVDERDEKTIFRYVGDITEMQDILKNNLIYPLENLQKVMSSSEANDKYKFTYYFSPTTYGESSYELYYMYGKLEDLQIYKRKLLFLNDKLYGYKIQYYDNYNDIEKPYNTYKKIRDYLSEKFGENNMNEKINVSNEKYKDNEEKYNEALKYNYMSIETNWENSQYKVYFNYTLNKDISIYYEFK